MTQKETINRNIGLTFDFVNYLMENKEEAEKLPERFELEFLEKDFPQLELMHEKQSVTPQLNKKQVRVKNSFDVIM